MFTENQTNKLKYITHLYFSNHDALEEMTQEKLIEILRKCKWNLTDATTLMIKEHQELIAEKIRISKLPNNVVRPFDNQGYNEIWSEFYKCPSCGRTTLCADTRDKYCSACGIKVDWSEIKI